MRWLFEKFAEWAFRNPMWALTAMFIVNFAIWGTIIYVISHFAIKYW